MALRLKFSLWLMGLVTFLVVAISVLTLYSERQLLLSEIREGHVQTMDRLVKVCVESVYQDDLLLLNYLKTLESERGFKSAFFADANGVIQVHSNPSQVGIKYQANSSKQEYALSSPVQFDNELVGSANLILDKSEIDQIIQDSQINTLKRMALIMCVALMLGYGGAFVLARTLVKPIQRLAYGMRLVSQGKFEPIPFKPRKDELGWLSNELNATIKKLKELDDMKQNFFSRITHELRSPLIAIDGLVSMIHKGMYGDVSPKIKELMVTTQNNTNRLKRLVDDLLTASKLEAKRDQVEPTEFDLVPLIKDSHTLYAPLSQEKGLSFHIQIPSHPVSVWAEPEKVQHILTNLLSNAFKFTKKGHVAIEMVDEGGDVKIKIADSGIGIPAAEQTKIFNKFYRSDVAKKIKGTGLGLNIVKDLVQLQGGNISVSTRPGGGAIFSFTLPKKRAA